VSDILSLDEATLLTGLKKATLYKHSHEGTIPAMRRGKKLIFFRKELQDWIDGQTVRKISPADKAVEHLRVEATKK
jgi:excisionase family DNA binding protein